jgi:hypothetical protein
VGSYCDWIQFGKTGFSCVEGFGDCLQPKFLLAETSPFHDEVLEDVSNKLNRILAQIPADTEGRKLSFCGTSMGIFLAWADHGASIPGGKTVNSKSDEKTIKKALKLKAQTGKSSKKR